MGRDVREITYGTFIHMLRSKDNYTDLPLIDANEVSYEGELKKTAEEIREKLF